MRNLETERLLLRKLEETDLNDIYNNWTSDPEVTEYLEWYAHESVEVTKMILDGWLKAYENEPCYRYGIVNKATNELMGMVDVVKFVNDSEPYIGYASGKRFWGNGYMSEALQALLIELRNDGYRKFHIWACRDNIASRRVIEKNGFSYIKTETRPMSKFKPVIADIDMFYQEFED